MSVPNSNLAVTKSLLLAMMAEAQELKQVAGGSVTVQFFNTSLLNIHSDWNSDTSI